MTTTLGRRLRELRGARRITQRDLAALVKVDFTYISKLENDRTERPPSEVLIRSLAKHLHGSADELLLLAQRIPSDVEESILRKPDHIELLRSAEKLSPEEYRALMRQLQEKVEGR